MIRIDFRSCDTFKHYINSGILCKTTKIICNVIDIIVDQNLSTLNGIKVKEVYGAFTEGGVVGHGRNPKSVVSITQEEALTFRHFLKNNDLNFTYLLNAPFEFDQDLKQYDLVLGHYLQIR